MNEKIKQYQNKLFNTLFVTFPTLRKLKDQTNNLNLIKPVTHTYSFTNKKFWFAEGEQTDKFVYFFGLREKSLKDITLDDATLIIDFDKNTQFNNTSLGLFSVSNSEIHILINYEQLKKRYPYFNTGNFKIKTIKSIDKKLNLKVIDLGSITKDFIENIEKLIELSSALEILDNEKDEVDLKNIVKDTAKGEQCYICLKNRNDVKINSNLGSLKNLKPEFCGECIEKIVVSEFYTKLTPLLKGNKSKYLKIAKKEYGNDQVFDIGLELLEKYNIIHYIGVKKLFFSLDKNSDLINEYIKYSDKNNLLIDNIFKIKTESSEKNEKKLKNTSLPKSTADKMNLFINALKSGKTHEKAYKIAKVDAETVDIWYNLGRLGNKEYVPFYNSYKPLLPKNLEKTNKMEKFLDELKKDGDIDNALKESNLKIEKVRTWYSLGKKNDPKYKDFYLACKILLPEGIPKKETKKIVDNEKLMTEFATLIDDGKTNEEAIEILKIPKFKVKNWINLGKLGNKKYVDFYNSYMIQINKQNALKKAKKLEKEKQILKNETQIKEEPDEIQKPLEENDLPNQNEKSCRICGRTLNKKTKKEICKRCARKQYASKIIIKFLGFIEPEKPFKKDDLKILDLQPIQITDYIWTLQEFNLIDKQNNTLKLKSKKTLDKFIKDSGLEVDEIETQTVKLNKKCEKCGQTLEISKFFPSESSEDGFEDNCKDCKKLINTASYLKEIMEYIDFNTEFSEEDLKPYFKDSFKLQAKIWSLLDSDLAKRNFEKDNYIFTDKQTAEEFLEKYYDKSNDIPKNTDNTHEKSETIKEPKDIVIEAMLEGKSRKEAADIANIPLYKITHWYNEGRQRYGNKHFNFYKQIKEIENNNKIQNEKLKNKMNHVLEELKANKDIDNLTHSNEKEINEWIEKGQYNKSPYVEFYDKYTRIINLNKNQNLKQYNNYETNRKIFLENLKSGKTKEESAKNADIELELLHKWYIKGSNGEGEYVEFYEEYQQIKNTLNESLQIPQLEKSNKNRTPLPLTEMNIILESLAKGMDEKEAVKKADISFNTYKYWINSGEQKSGKLYTQFYQYVNEIKNGKYIINENMESKDNLSSSSNEIKHHIYDSLPKEMIKSTKINQTGIAWVNKTNNRWTYSRIINGKQINISENDIYKLFEKVMDKDLVWGIIDYEKAKNIIDFPEEFIPNNDITQKIPKNSNRKIDPDIYAPLPDEYIKQFNPSQTNKTGIAWVNKTGNKWTYSRTIYGKKIYFTDADIYKLHKQVKDANQIWGIKDYNKAKYIIDIPNDFKFPDYVEKPIEISDDILAPLPEKYLDSFNPKQKNKTGIAWVNKTGEHAWTYQRIVNKIPFRFSNPDIHKLHEIVIKNGHVWGIIDYDKAIPIIESKTTESNKTPIKKKDTNQISTMPPSTVSVIYLEKPKNKHDVIIKGIIKNKELLDVLNRLKLFEINIKRIVTTSINPNVDIFIELELNKFILKRFEENIADLNWNIKK